MPSLSTVEINQVLIQFHPQGVIQVPGGRSITLGHSPQGRGQPFVLTGLDFYPGYKFAFPALSAPATRTMQGSTECFCHRHNNDSIELDVETAIWPLQLPMALNQQAKKGVAVRAGVIDVDYQGEIGLQVHTEGEEECVWNAEGLLGASSYSHVLGSKSMTSINSPIQVELPVAQTLRE